MSFIDRQQQPILILDSIQCKRNIERIAERAKKAGCDFRPHFKTHQSKIVGHWFRDFGITGITVSSIAMANYFIEDGWNDITIAFPFFHSQISGLKKIEKNASLRLFINSVSDLEVLNKELQNPFKFYIEIDSGAGRSGISYQNEQLISELIIASKELSKCTFHGFYVHDGRTYRSRSKEEIKETINPTFDIMVNLKSQFPEANISIGDTPSASVSDRLDELDEITPGNFVFYDYMQVQIGSCTLDDVALFSVLPIAQKIPDANQTILHGGAVHLSKEFLAEFDYRNYGQAIRYSKISVSKLDNLCLTAISQEHGTLNGVPSEEDHLWVCPIHSCLTANLHSQYFTPDGEIIEKRILS